MSIHSVTQVAAAGLSKRRSWFRFVASQILITSGVSFTAPGMWDALGGLGAGGAINLGLNTKRFGTGSVSSATYIVFIVIMCLGLPIALYLSSAEKVWRKDGTRIVTHRQATWRAEFRATFRLLVSRRILLLLPAFFISYFYNGSFIIATLLDRQLIRIKTRAKVAFAAIVTVLVATWIWAAVRQKQFYDASEKHVLDWFRGDLGKAYALVFFWTFASEAFQQFPYWLVGQYATDLSSLSHHTGILRGFEALGQTVAWAMQSEGNANHFVSIGINFGILLISVLPTWVVLSELEHSHEVRVTDETEEEVIDQVETTIRVDGK